MILCDHCKGDLEVRNPKGFCDHTLYPRHCKICKEMRCYHIWVRAIDKYEEKKAFCMKCFKVDFDSEDLDLLKVLEENRK